MKGKTILHKAISIVNKQSNKKLAEDEKFGYVIFASFALCHGMDNPHLEKEVEDNLVKYLLSIYTVEEWYHNFEYNTAGCCFMNCSIEADGINMLYEYVETRKIQYQQIYTDLLSPNEDMKYIYSVLYHLLVPERFCLYPLFDLTQNSYSEICEFWFLKTINGINDDYISFESYITSIINHKKTQYHMEQSFSFRYIKLGIGLAFLLVSSMLPGIGQYSLIAMGGIALMTAFASFGNYNYRGVSSILTYRIIRYVLAALLLVIAAIQICVHIAMPNTVHYSPYSTVVDVALIAYLLMYKPSDTTIGKKILKTAGYVAILIGVNTLQNAQRVIDYMTYTDSMINWGAVLASAIAMSFGVVLIILSNRKP